MIVKQEGAASGNSLPYGKMLQNVCGNSLPYRGIVKKMSYPTGAMSKIKEKLLSQEMGIVYPFYPEKKLENGLPYSSPPPKKCWE